MEPGRFKAYCPKCYMTFEAGKNSKRAINHLQQGNCDLVPCSKPQCVRKFGSINSANRHTYCYTTNQVRTWHPHHSITQQLAFQFQQLSIHEQQQDIDQFLDFSEAIKQGPPYKYPDRIRTRQVLEKIKKKLPLSDCENISQQLEKRGFSNIGVLRIAKRNQGNWQFLQTQVADERVCEALKYLVSKPPKKSKYEYS